MSKSVTHLEKMQTDIVCLGFQSCLQTFPSILWPNVLPIKLAFHYTTGDLDSKKHMPNLYCPTHTSYQPADNDRREPRSHPLHEIVWGVGYCRLNQAGGGGVVVFPKSWRRIQLWKLLYIFLHSANLPKAH